MNLLIERKIEVVKWIVKARWYYMGGIFLIGILTKTLSESNVGFPVWIMVAILTFYFIVNWIFFFLTKKAEILKSNNLLSVVGLLQIAVELAAFTLIMHLAGGIESISYIFFFLTVVSASLLFGARGGLIVAVISAFLINGLVILEYYDIIHHIPRYGVGTLEFETLSIAITITITISIFYIIVGSFAGFGSKLLFKRELLLQEKTESLDKSFKEIQEEKRKSEEEKNRTLTILSNFTDPVIVLDKNNQISLFNEPAKEFLGLKSTDINRKVSPKNNYSLENFKDIIKTEFASEKIEGGTGNKIMVEEINLKHKGKDLTYKVTTVKITGQRKKHIGIMKIFYDLTREKNIDKMKSDFISIAAHQLRTPLSAVKWAIGMVLDGDAGKINIEQENFLSKGFVSNERMIALVNDLLNVSRIEEGKLKYNFEKTDFQEIISKTVKTVGNSLDKKNIKLTLKGTRNIPEVLADKEKMTLALQNLLDNAVKYTPEKGKVILSTTQKGDFLEISVKDNGVGIPEKDKPKMFSKFFRASNVLKLDTDGTGLGLFIIKTIIESHGGTIRLESAEGKGTEVTFTIPIVKKK